MFVDATSKIPPQRNMLSRSFVLQFSICVILNSTARREAAEASRRRIAPM